MPSPTTRMAYIDIYEIYDKALDDPKGLRVPFDTYGAAKHFQLRCHQARSINRRENLTTYEEGHALHGASVYDKLAVSIKTGEDGTFFVYIEHRAQTLGEIEMLSEMEDETNHDT